MKWSSMGWYWQKFFKKNFSLDEFGQVILLSLVSEIRWGITAI